MLLPLVYSDFLAKESHCRYAGWRSRNQSITRKYMTFKNFSKILSDLPDIVPFVGPEAHERASGKPFVARLGANENGFGFSPKVTEIVEQATDLAWRYGDPENYDLKHAISAQHNVDISNIVIGTGIDSLLGSAVRMIVDQGTQVVTSKGAYPTFNYHANGCGGTIHFVPYKDDFEDLDGLLDKVRSTNAAMVYLSNPDNPMGTYWRSDDILNFVDQLPETTMFLLDEAYIELAPDDAAPAANALIDRSNVLRMRTFSKAYALAGMRVGYAIGAPETIAMFNRIRDHFGMSLLSQKAAEAAIKDQAHLIDVQTKVRAARDRISSFVQTFGYQPIPSATNFVSFDCGRDGAFAKSIMQQLMDAGIFVRMPFAAPQNRCVRVSVGPNSELEKFEKAFENIHSGMKGA